MNKKQKIKIFAPLIKNFETEEVVEYFKDMIAEIPDYIFTMPSSTSGKYHNAAQCKRFGQIYHIYMFAIILNYRLGLKMNREKYNNPVIRDCMRCVPVLHDAIKCGWNGSKYSVSEHPALAAEWVRNTKVKHMLDNELIEMIAGMCEAHSGEWNKDRKGNVIMPEPRNDMEFFIHECDYLASRVDLDLIIPDELTKILDDFDNQPDESQMSTDDYILDFGKYKGKTLSEIAEIDFGYINWMKDNLDREPVATLLKKFTPNS